MFLNFMRKFKRFLESYDNDTEKMQINYLDQLNNKEYEGLFGSEKNHYLIVYLAEVKTLQN